MFKKQQKSTSQLIEQDVQFSNHFQRVKILKNNFVFTMILECLVIITQLFALIYYRWYYESAQDIWLSLIYAYSNHYMSYRTLRSMERYASLCDNSEFVAFRTLGLIMFIVLILVICTIMGDMYRLYNHYLELNGEPSKHCICRGKCLYLISFVAIAIIYIYAIIQILILSFLSLSEVGASFIVGCVGAVVYLSTIIIYLKIKGRMRRVKYIEKLLKEEETLEITERKSAPSFSNSKSGKSQNDQFKSCLQDSEPDFQSV